MVRCKLSLMQRKKRIKKAILDLRDCLFSNKRSYVQASCLVVRKDGSQGERRKEWLESNKTTNSEAVALDIVIQ